MHRLRMLALALPLVVPTRAHAQDLFVMGTAWIALSAGAIVHLIPEPTVTLKPGDTVRVERLGETEATGVLIGIDADSIRLRTGGYRVSAVARAGIDAVQKYEGPRTKWAEGWLAGFLVGGGVGAAIGIKNENDRYACLGSCTDARKKMLGHAALGAFVGSIAGAAIGYHMEGDHWRDARSLSASVTPGPGGVTLGASWRY